MISASIPTTLDFPVVVSSTKNPTPYRICLEGVLDLKWANWFEGFKLRSEGGETVLLGWVTDQSALHGIIAIIRDLGMPIISIHRVRGSL